MYKPCIQQILIKIYGPNYVYIGKFLELKNKRADGIALQNCWTLRLMSTTQQPKKVFLNSFLCLHPKILSKKWCGLRNICLGKIIKRLAYLLSGIVLRFHRCK